ncbi:MULTISPECIES: NAD-dependent epimerase/dehydratase family protein [unclassified Streptomyces]|uniref:NAD-dependent epimerase/dehydratase family protein n=1 Tax=unclassified Streptomyces TaxID=2593676 RepID=UPI000804DE81|nr:NAD-dependent epimerase/dehydratase family protein [Streptomyces sp. OspMP-M45]MYR75025.1 NAD-dependent epimerase/dehydratase family protein [Streptomyces sp. SID4925]SBV00421.1 Predicted nucleoside-diphosphate sugar epimerases [Streptomyces sp. OspMP-M45]
MQNRSALSELKGTTVLVTGGAGLIGSRITARLKQLGARPIALCNMNAYSEHVYSNVFGVDTTHPDTVIGDVRETVLVRKLVAESDYVIHAAALGRVFIGSYPHQE